ncbi:MAG: hypothetical protein II781_03105 [Clostridia bacterium]|nr:hypothetical protein [Clostridia bacterium]
MSNNNLKTPIQHAAGTAGGVVVQINQARIQAVRAQIDGYTKQLGVQLKSIQNDVNSIKSDWETSAADQFIQEAGKRIKDVQVENDTIEKNVKTFLEEILEKFAETEAQLIKNADLFK